MESPPDLRPDRPDEPLLVVGFIGLFAGLAAVALMRDAQDPNEIARTELAAMANRVTFLVIALAGAWVRARRSMGFRPLVGMLAVGLLALLVHEVGRIYLFDWHDVSGTATVPQLTSMVYVLAAVAFFELSSQYEEIPRASFGQSVQIVRRLAWLLLGLGVLATAIGLGVHLTRRSEIGLAASTAACAIAIAIVSAALDLAWHAPRRVTRWLASTGAALLTWAVVVHAIHGCILYMQWNALRSFVYYEPPPLFSEWLSALSYLAPIASSAGLIALILAIRSLRRRPIERTEYLLAGWIGIAATGLYIVQRGLMPQLNAFDESLPLVMFFYAAPPAAIAPFLWDVARELERQHESDLAAAWLAEK